MARRSPVKVGLALALVFAVTIANADDKCRTGCQGAAQTFKYQEGTTYKYSFDSKIEIILSSAENQKSLTEVKAQVLLTQQPQCNQLLRLTNVQIIAPNGKKYNQIADIEKPIRLNFHDGHIEDSICTVPGDNQNSLNIKRAIASIFQANLKNGHETDVFGLCPTEVTHSKEGSFVVVQKARNLNRCAYRESIKQDFLTTAFNLNSEIKSSPLLNADYRAKLKIKNGILDQATVNEDYIYVPFSVGNNGAKAKVETTLKFTGSSKDGASDATSAPRSLIFEDPHPIVAPSSNVNSLLSAVKETAKTIGVTVNENTAKEFVNLVKVFRAARKDDLLAVYNQVKAGVGFADKTTAKKLYLDALIRAGNGDTIEVALTLLKNKELSPLEEKLVYFGLSLVRHTTENSLNAASELINQANLPREAYLGIGSLAGKHCRQHSCKNNDAVNRLTQTLLQKIGNGKADNRNKENDIVYSLKAISNIQHLTDAVANKIIAIAQDKNAPTRIRVTALETYQSDACKDKLRESALTILKDIQQDSEIRIKAYLALAQCPNAKIGSAIKALLDNEPSYQIAGFIVSHIKNIRASANPDKELAKQHLGFINVPKKYPFDLRKYSANGEFSYSIDTLGIANSIETNIIYSQKSWLPRSTSLNLTADVFGHALNFLEIETRQENLDRLVEHYLGPKSFLRTKGIHEIINKESATNLIKNLRQKVEKSLRSRRDVSKSEIDQITKQVHIKTSELNKDLDLDLSIKAFGSEVIFFNLNDDHKKYTPDAIIDQIVDNLNKGIDKLKRFDETLRTNLLFLDAEFAYPTSSGYPLRLGVEGSSNIQIKASGAIDLRALFKQDSTLKINLIPSATVDIAGRLTIDTQLVESGLKVASSLHTSTGGDLIVDLFSHGIDVKFALPVEKQTLVSASHNIVLHTRELGAPEKNQPLKFAQNKDFSICLDQLSPMIGLTFCAEANGPNLVGKSVPVLPFPLSGDAKVAVTIEKDDISQFHYREVLHDSQGKAGGEVLFETLSKSGERKLALHGEAFILPEKYFKGTLTSSIISGEIEGRITDSEAEKSALLRFKYQNDEYFGKIGVGIEGSPARASYKPIIQYRTPQTKGLQTPPYTVTGEILVEKNGGETKYNFNNLKLVASNQKAISINGHLGHQPQTVYADLTLSDGANSGTLKGRLQANPPKLIKYNCEVTNSLNPDANFHIKGELQRDGDQIVKHFFQISHGRDLSSKTNLLRLENSLKVRNKSPQDFLVETNNKLTYPLLTVDLQFDFKLNPKEVGYNLGGQYRDIKVGSELDFEHSKKADGVDYDLDFEIYGLNNKLEVKSKRKVAGDTSQIENSIEANGKKFEINGKVTHHIKPHDLDIGTDLVVKTPSQPPLKVVSGLKVNPAEIDAHQKISSGGTVYSEGFLKANKNGNANGNIKINLPQRLVVNGQLKANKGVGNGDITIELPAIKKTTKADATFTIHSPQYNVAVNFYPFFNEDPSKKISLTTNSKITTTSIDSKNLIDIVNHKLEVNIKGNQDGEIHNGKTNGEIEITLPNNHYLAAKLNREMRNDKNIVNGKVFGSLEHRENKNTPGGKVTLTGNIRNTNVNAKTIDVDYKLSAENGNGKNLNIDLAVKRIPNGDVINTEIINRITGAALKHPIETTIRGTCQNDLTHTIDLTSSCGPQDIFKLNGKIDLGSQNGAIQGNFNVDLQSSSKIWSVLKASGSGSVLRSNGVEVKGSGHVYGDSGQGYIVDVGGDGQVKVSDKEARVKGSVSVAKRDPLSIDAGVSIADEKNKQKIQGDVTLGYGKGQKVTGDFTLLRLPRHEYKLDVKLKTPTEKYKDNRLQVHTKRSEDNTRHESDVILTSDGKSWNFKSDLLLSQIAPGVSVKATNPDNKVCEFVAKITKITNDQFGAQLKIANQEKNFLLEGDIDAEIENIDNFHIKGHLNSPSLKINKVEYEALNKPSKSGKRIQVNAKAAGKNVVSGSTSYSTREDHGKFIVEGSGSFKVKDESKSANFKYIKQNLVAEKNGETGIEISFDAALGKKAIDAEFKATNKQFRIANSYCEEKEQCAHVEIDSKTLADELARFNHVIEITIDLRKLGLSHEFGLKAVTDRKEYQLDHTVDVHFQSDANSKYQYSLYLHPKQAGVSLTTPKRIIALESKLDAPRTLLKDGGRISGELVLYLDKKNQPNQKSGIIGFLNVNPNGHEIDGEIKFTNPGLQRPFLISGKSKLSGNTLTTDVTVDVFAQPAQKILIHVQRAFPDLKNKQQYDAKDVFTIKSAGLNLEISGEASILYLRDQHVYKQKTQIKYHHGNHKYNSLYNIELSPTVANLHVILDNIEIIRVNSKLQVTKDTQIVDSDVSTFALKPTKAHLELKNYNTLKLTFERPDINAKLQVNSGLIPGQIADFRAEVIKGGARHELLHGSIKLDEANFLKSDYGVQSKNIEEHFLKQLKTDVDTHLNEIKKITTELNNNALNEIKELGELSKRAIPNVTPMKNYYISELKKIQDEILADKTIKDISEFLHNILATLSQVFGETLKHFGDLVESLVKAFQVSFEKTVDILQKEVIPKAIELNDKILHLVSEFIEKTSDVVLTYLAKISQVIEKYQPELKQIGAAFSEITQDVVRVVLKAYQRVRDVVGEQIRLIYEEIKALPAFEALKAEYNNMVQNNIFSSENFVGTVKDFFSTLRDIAPTDDLKALIDAISQYVTQKLSNQNVDDVAALDRISKAALTVVRGITGALATGEDVDFHGIKLPVPVNIWNKLPRIAATKFSPISYLLREDVADPTEFLLSLVNRPRQWFAPFPLQGIIAQGQHIFTFDGKHLTFPGKCNYLIAHDALDGNFSIAGTYENGILTSISLAEGRDVVTLKKGGLVTLNNAQTDLPVRKPNIAAFRDYYTVTLISDAGARVVCGPELIVCFVSISGFYHGKLRGLLGNGNNDPYDDFTQANGKIVVNEADFANSFKMSSGCPAVQTVSHHGHHPSPTCDKLFGHESNMRACYWFVKPDNYKMACEHGVAAGVKDTEYAISAAYTLACYLHAIPIEMPDEFLTCSNSDSKIDHNIEFNTKLPRKSADIVLLVDTVKKNEPVYKEYVTPLVAQLTNELSKKGISDIQFHLITYGGENQWPSHVTVNGQLTFKSKAPEVKFSDGPKKPHLITGEPTVDHLISVLETLAHDLDLALGLDLQSQTYNEGLKYPFRVDSIKSIIAVTGSSCEVGVFYPVQLLRTLLYRDKTIKLNVITPFTNLKVRDDKHTKEVIGFNADAIFTQSQAKAKGGKGGSELHKELEYNDYCVSFTVQNGGNVFVTDNFLSSKGAARKQFVTATSHAIVEQFLNEEQFLECKCKTVTPLAAQNVCKVIHTEPRKGGAKS